MRSITSIVESCMRYNRLVILVTSVLVALGVIGLKLMPKQEFPEFTIRQGVVVGVYPGATSSQVEEELAKPLERFLFTYKEVKRDKTYSMSKDGIVYVMVELQDNVHDKDKVWNKIKLGLQGFKSQLSPEILAIVAQDDFGDTSALLISMESDDKTSRELDHYMEKLEERLLQIESVSNLRRYGVQKEQIAVYIDQNKLIGYGIDQRLIMSSLSSEWLKTTGGSIDNGETELPIYFNARYKTEQDVAEKVLYIDARGNTVRVKDVARVVREYPSPDSYIRNNGTPTVLLSLEMRVGYNIIEYGKQVDKVIADFVRDLPPSIKIKRIADQPVVVADSVYSFLRDLGLAIVIVILVMLLLFPWRSAVIAATTIPITIFLSLAVMYLVGIPLNTVTLAALIVVLGMIVDNSIVVLDGYLENLDSGMSRWYAAVVSATKYFGSILLATLCISIIFFPFLFITTGMIRDFLNFFPWTIFLTLMISVIVSMVMIPFMEYSLIKEGLKANAKTKEKKFDMLKIVQGTYDKVLSATMKHPWTTVGCGTLSVVLAIFMFAQMEIKLMPTADRNQFAVEIYLPEGSSLDKTAEISDSLQSLLEGDERITSITSFVGMASPRFQATYAPNLPGKNYGQFIVNTESSEATIELLDEYTDLYANYFANAYVRFKQLDYNRVSNPIEVRFQGDDIAQLKQQAESLEQYLHTIPGITWIHSNYAEPLPAININLHSVETARMGVNTTTASMQMAMQSKGVTVAEIWEDEYSLPVVIKSEFEEGKKTLETATDLKKQYINSSIPNVAVPLRQIANIDPVWNEGQIVRRGGLRTLSVMADFQRSSNTEEVQSQIIDYVNDIVIPELPKGVTCHLGGLVEADKEDLEPIIMSLLAALMLIFLFLLIDYRRIFISVISLLSLTLCLLGAAIGLWGADLPISLTAVLGIVSLMGIVVRNVILIFQHADMARVEQKASAFDAAFDAGQRRMVPIFLTSMTTAVGVIPMIISKSSLWYPMGTVICFGTISAMISVVLVLPAVYLLMYRKYDKK